MEITTTEKEGRALVKIEGAISVAEAGTFRDELLKCLKDSKGLILDLEHVTACDTAGIQILYSARSTAGETGKDFAVAGASAQAIDSLIQAGLNPDEILAG